MRYPPIGGPNKTVELDETKVGRSKYNRGRPVSGTWIFGGVCRENPDQTFMMPVEYRDAKTLIPLINAHVAQGSQVVTDGWAAYKKVGESYDHVVINHKVAFVDEDGEH